jgi:hypothetical protein
VPPVAFVKTGGDDVACGDRESVARGSFSDRVTVDQDRAQQRVFVLDGLREVHSLRSRAKARRALSRKRVIRPHWSETAAGGSLTSWRFAV